jgi:hypothetical protein
MKKKFFETIYYFFYRKYKNIEDFFYGIKWFCQRGKNGYADIDLFRGIDNYVASIISKSLKELIKIKHGTSMCFFEGNKWDYSEEEHENASKKQDEYLKKTSELFARYENFWDDYWMKQLNLIPGYEEYIHKQFNHELKDNWISPKKDEIMEQKIKEVENNLDKEYKQLVFDIIRSLKFANTWYD